MTTKRAPRKKKPKQCQHKPFGGERCGSVADFRMVGEGQDLSTGKDLCDFHVGDALMDAFGDCDVVEVHRYIGGEL